MITIGITSCNRLKYLKALLKSIEPMKEDGVQVIVADMGSTEPGLRDYLASLDWVETYLHNKKRDWINDEYIAKNELISRSKHDFAMYVQDDGQLIVPKEYVYQCVEDMKKTERECCHFEIFAVRSITLQTTTQGAPTIINGNKYFKKNNVHVGTKGIFKTELFQETGAYPVNWETKKSNWGRSEDWYDSKIKSVGRATTYRTQVPLFAGIWNDPRGLYAFIRGNKRFGHYLDPADDSGLYYDILSMDEIEELKKRDRIYCFNDVVRELGWEVVRDPSGDMKKYSQKLVMEEGPSEDLPEQVL